MSRSIVKLKLEKFNRSHMVLLKYQRHDRLFHENIAAAYLQVLIS